MELSKKQEKEVKQMMEETGGCRVVCETFVTGNLLGIRATQLTNGEPATEMFAVSQYEANNRSYMTNFLGDQMYNQFNPHHKTPASMFWKKGEESAPYVMTRNLNEYLKDIAETTGCYTVLDGNTGDVYEMTDKLWESHLSVVK